MAGNEWSEAGINNQIASFAIQLNNLFFQIQSYVTSFNNGNDGVAWNAATLQSVLGVSAADAAQMVTIIGYLNNEQGVHFGTATVGSDFDFFNAYGQITGGRFTTGG